MKILEKINCSDIDCSEVDINKFTKELKIRKMELRPLLHKITFEMDRLPLCMIEVGSYLGHSAIAFSKLIREVLNENNKDEDLNIYCVDTWLGSYIHWLEDKYHEDLSFKNGRPEMYHSFLKNIKAFECEKDIIPVPLDNLNAARILAKNNIRVPIVYIDGSHEYPDIYLDCMAYWQLIMDGGYICGDDWCKKTNPYVVEGVNKFAKERGLKIKVGDAKWFIRKI